MTTPNETKLFLMLVNDITNQPDPKIRVLFARKLVQGLGRLLVAPPEVIEQLCAKLDQEIEQFKDVTDPESHRKAKHHIELLRIFLRYRQPMLDEIERVTGLKIDLRWPL